MARRAGRCHVRPSLVAQDVPHVARMVGDTRYVLDDLSHTWQRPQVGGISVRLGAAGECFLDINELSVGQLRFASSTAGATQAVAAIRLHALRHSETI
jgi:hypothetical protein